MSDFLTTGFLSSPSHSGSGIRKKRVAGGMPADTGKGECPYDKRGFFVGMVSRTDGSIVRLFLSAAKGDTVVPEGLEADDTVPSLGEEVPVEAEPVGVAA